MNENITRETITLKNGKSLRIYTIPQLNQPLKYPSVTTICNTEVDDQIWLQKWAKKEIHTKEITLYGNTVGTFGHFRIQTELAKKWNIMTPQLELQPDQRQALKDWYSEFPYRKTEGGIKNATDKMLMVFDQWMWDFDPQHPIQMINGQRQDANIYPFEFNAWSNRFGYAGSIDILSALKFTKETDLRNTLVDIKTTLTDSSKYELQVMGYVVAFREMYPHIPLDEYRILHIPKDNQNFRYIFKDIKPYEDELRIQWLFAVRKFYELYGDQPPMNQYKETVLENLRKEGV